MAKTRLSQLAQAIAQNTDVLEKYYEKADIPVPSFEVGTLVDTTINDDETAERARISLIDDSIELRDLLEGPTMLIRPTLNATSLQAIYKFNIPAKIPLEPNSDISYEELASQCGVELDILRRLIRFAIAHHRIFREKCEGFVSHSAASKLLAESPDAMACTGVFFDEIYQSCAHTVEALQIYPHQTPSQCGFTIVQNANTPAWEVHAQNPELSQRFSRAMRQLTRGFGHDTVSLLTGWDWASLKDGLVVDLGGANGHASVLLARKYPGLRLEVQDLPHVVQSARDGIPADVQDRVTFRAQDFTEPQATQADVFLIRQILHDWPDDTVIKILRALIPALRPGVRIVVNDNIVPAPGTIALLAEKHIRALDMMLMSFMAGKEREKSDWERVFKDADPRFTNFRAHQSSGSCMGIVEVTWSG